MLVEELNVSTPIAAALAQESARFKKAVENCLDDMRALNLLHSSITLEKLSVICQQSFHERLTQAWRILAEAAAEQIDRSEGLADEFMAYLEKHTPEFYPDMQEVIALASKIADPGEPALKNFEATVGQGRFMAFRRLRPVIESHVAGLSPLNACSAPHAKLPGDACLHCDMINLESFELQDELHSTLFALEFAINGLPEAEAKQAILPLVRALRSAIDQPCIALRELDALCQAAAGVIRPIAALSEIYADLKAVLAGLEVSLP